MNQHQRSREEYSALLARAFNGAITVDGQRIVAHPSGILFTRAPTVSDQARAKVAAYSSALGIDRDNDWSEV